MVFQIADDALDLVADESTIGKPAGSDIREGTFTMPVLAAAAGPDGERVRELLEPGIPYDDDAVTEVISLVRRGGHIEDALTAATSRLTKAEAALESIEPGLAHEILTELGTYLLARVESARD
jgi:geranylgeranyl pyrophosphate synthase